jgi:hypothetical protein
MQRLSAVGAGGCVSYSAVVGRKDWHGSLAAEDMAPMRVTQAHSAASARCLID